MTELSVHTELLNKGAIAANRRIFALDRHPINDIGVSQGRTELKDRSGIGRLTIIRRTIASGASAAFGWLLAAIYKSQRKKVAIELAIHDPRCRYSPWMKTAPHD